MTSPTRTCQYLNGNPLDRDFCQIQRQRPHGIGDTMSHQYEILARGFGDIDPEVSKSAFEKILEAGPHVAVGVVLRQQPHMQSYLLHMLEVREWFAMPHSQVQYQEGNLVVSVYVAKPHAPVDYGYVDAENGPYSGYAKTTTSVAEQAFKQGGEYKNLAHAAWQCVKDELDHCNGSLQ